MITVFVYYREKSAEIDQIVADLNALQEAVPHKLVVIPSNQDLVEIGPYRLHLPVTRQDLHVRLNAAHDRVDQLEKVDQKTYQQRVDKGRTLSSSDRITFWLSKHYLALVNVLLLVYVGLPFLAPMLVKNGINFPATVIYRVYGTMCHQLAFRSWFIFGEQAFYPRELAGISNVLTYEVLQDSQDIDLIAARNFVGNEMLGYKVALCQRDIAIYAAIPLFGLVFLAFRRKFPPIPWYLWVVVGLGPIGLDGVSQLTSFSAGLPGWLPIRESTPLLRTITGGLFGWMTAWYIMPMLESTAVEARRMMQRKMAAVKQSDPGEGP
jgi:uncharacterized membrane protein